MKKNKNNIQNQQHSIEYLKAVDEAADSTRIARYVFALILLFLSALFATYFWPKGQQSLLSSELIHFMAGSLFTAFVVIVDRYFKSASQKDAEKDLTYLVGKLKQEEQSAREEQAETE